MNRITIKISMEIVALLFIISLIDVNLCLSQEDNLLAYVKGKQRTLIKIISPDTTSKLVLPDHHTMTNAQQVIETGKNKQGQYIILEMQTKLPSSIQTYIKFPINNTAIPDSVKDFLAATSKIPIQHEEIANLVRTIMGTKKYVYQDEVVEALITWVSINIQYDYSFSDDQNAITVLNRKRGTCAGYANLCLALLRHVRIPCRPMSCAIPPNCGWGIDNRGGDHAFIEIYYPDIGWLGYDPQISLHFVDPFHIITQVGGSKYHWLPKNLEYEFIEDQSQLYFVPLKAFREDFLLTAVIRNGIRANQEFIPYSFRNRRKDQTEVSVLPNGDRRITYPDGKEEYIWVWGDKKIIYPDGRTETIDAKEPYYPQKKLIIENPGGDKRIFYPNGTKEYVWSSGDKKITYNDGKEVYFWHHTRSEIRKMMANQSFSSTKKIAYPDGKEKYEFAIIRYKAMLFDILTGLQANYIFQDYENTFKLANCFHGGIRFWLFKGFAVSADMGYQNLVQVESSSKDGLDTKFKEFTKAVQLEIPFPFLIGNYSGLWIYPGVEVVTRKMGIQSEEVSQSVEPFKITAECYRLAGGIKIWLGLRGGFEILGGYRWLQRIKESEADTKKYSNDFDNIYFGLRLNINIL